MKQGLIVGAAALVAIVLAVGGASEPVESAEANVAPCSASEIPATSGRRAPGALTAGPVTVSSRPLQRTLQAGDGQLHAKMGIQVTGHQYVVLSVPLGLRKRVFLYYGEIGGGEGGLGGTLFAGPGYSETELQPCPGRRRTIWPGGLRIIGHAPVNLLVTVEGHSHSTALPLGRPEAIPRR